MRRASSILNSLSPDGLASASAASAARRKAAWSGGRRPVLPPLTGAPWFQCDTAERDAGLRDQSVLQAERGGGGDDGEGVGRAFADFQVARMGGEACGFGGRRTAVISSPGSSIVSRSGVRAGQQVEAVERDVAASGRRLAAPPRHRGR